MRSELRPLRLRGGTLPGEQGLAAGTANPLRSVISARQGSEESQIPGARGLDQVVKLRYGSKVPWSGSSDSYFHSGEVAKTVRGPARGGGPVGWALPPPQRPSAPTPGVNRWEKPLLTKTPKRGRGDMSQRQGSCQEKCQCSANQLLLGCPLLALCSSHPPNHKGASRAQWAHFLPL